MDAELAASMAHPHSPSHLHPHPHSPSHMHPHPHSPSQSTSIDVDAELAASMAETPHERVPVDIEQINKVREETSCICMVRKVSMVSTKCICQILHPLSLPCCPHPLTLIPHYSSLPFFPSPSLPHSPSYSLSHPHSHPHSYPSSTLTLTHAPSPSPPHSPSHMYPHPYFLTHPHPLPHTLTPSLTLTLTHPHPHPLTLFLTHSPPRSSLTLTGCAACSPATGARPAGAGTTGEESQRGPRPRVSCTTATGTISKLPVSFAYQ